MVSLIRFIARMLLAVIIGGLSTFVLSEFLGPGGMARVAAILSDFYHGEKSVVGSVIVPTFFGMFVILMAIAHAWLIDVENKETTRVVSDG